VALQVTTIMLGSRTWTGPRSSMPGAWGGYFGYFSDPDGYLWKVAATA